MYVEGCVICNIVLDGITIFGEIFSLAVPRDIVGANGYDSKIRAY